MVPNVAGFIVKPIDFCYVTCVCISGETRAIYPLASDQVALKLYRIINKSFVVQTFCGLLDFI